MSLRVCTLLHDLLPLTKHCVGARISSFGLVARVPPSGENSIRTLLGEGFPLATRSTRARKQPKRANLALEIANLAPPTADKAAKKPSSKPSVRKPSSARPLSSSSVPVAAVIPADTPQGLAACFAAFYPGSKAEDKAKFQQFVLDNTLCPRHVLNMPVEKCESMLQQHGFEGVVVFTFQSRLREVCLPAAARGA